MLNNEFIEGLQGQGAPRKYFDGKGMYLYLQPSGAKYWRLKYRYHGREKTFSMGVFPRITLAEARIQTDQAKQQLKQGIDPSEFKQNQAFELVAREWFDNEKGGWKHRHAKTVMKSLEDDVFPYIGKRKIGVIRPPELLTVIRRIENRGALQVATKVLQRIRAIFRYAIQTGRATQNHATELQGVIKTKKVQHRKSLAKELLATFTHDLNNYAGLPATRLAIQLMLLTFVRTDELREASWQEFDIKNAVWRIPEHRTKKETVHLVPLSKQAIQLLTSMPNYGETGYLFEGRAKGKTISDKTMIQAIYRMGYKNKATIHGFRKLASTILNESGLFTVDAIERQLAHVEGNAVRRAYNHAQYLPERTQMMQWWADYLGGVQSKKAGLLLSLRQMFIR